MEDLMDFTRAFRYILDDKDWLSKVGLGLLIMAVPILNFAWIGYQVQIIRNVRKNEAVILPTWDDLGKKFMDGLMIVLAGLIYSLPILLVSCLPLAIMLVPALASDNQDLFNVLMTSSMVVYFCLICLFVLYALVISIISPIMRVFYAKEGTFAACFKIREFFQTLSRNAGPFFTIWLVSLGVSIGVSVAVSIVGAVVGWFPIIGQLVLLALGLAGPAYVAYFSSHMYGQFAALVFGSES
jgi:hypothetical protein